jgi:hypothetical protein
MNNILSILSSMKIKNGAQIQYGRQNDVIILKNWKFSCFVTFLLD